ncbi:MAG: hypothetical protein V2I33_24570 [Kangiellaceae bacterium]|jgi:hypothetical protein|nr:hypothetical protein [Kangiellaceae bacterium]
MYILPTSHTATPNLDIKPISATRNFIAPSVPGWVNERWREGTLHTSTILAKRLSVRWVGIPTVSGVAAVAVEEWLDDWTEVEKRIGTA